MNVEGFAGGIAGNDHRRSVERATATGQRQDLDQHPNFVRNVGPSKPLQFLIGARCRHWLSLPAVVPEELAVRSLASCEDNGVRQMDALGGRQAARLR